MANLICNGTGNIATSTIWDTITNAPTIHASTNVTPATGAGTNTATFTAPNITNAATGILIYVNVQGSAGTVTANLQESTVTKASVTVNQTDLTAGQWNYLQLTSPYVFTTTGAGAYRWNVVVSAANGMTTAADSGGTLIAYKSSDNRHSFGTVDNLDIASIWTAATTKTDPVVTVTGTTSTCGNATDTQVATERSVGLGIGIWGVAKLKWDTTADSTLTVKGTVVVGGQLEMGTTGSPMTFNATLKFNENGTSGNFGMKVSSTCNSFSLQGTAKTTTSLWKTKLSSGTGTTGSPLVTADAVAWAAGDEVWTAPTSNNATNYNEGEFKFLKVVNSSTSFTLSDTSGGVESGYTNAHSTDAWILNLTRTVVITSTNTAQAWYLTNAVAAGTAVKVAWARFEYCGSTTSNKTTIMMGTGAWDYSVAYKSLYIGLTPNAGSILTYTGLIVVGGSNATQWGVSSAFDLAGKNMTDCFFVGNAGGGFLFTAAANYVLTRCYAIANKATGATFGGFVINTASNMKFYDCEAHCNNWAGLDLYQGMTSTLFNNFLCGTKGTNNTADLLFGVANNFFDITFNNPLFGSSTLLSNFSATNSGSELRFQKFNQTANNHIWYTPVATNQSTGATLADTNVRTAGSLGLRLAPTETTVGAFWDFKILAKASSVVFVVGFIQKNAAFGSSTCRVDLYLPGKIPGIDSADATQTMPNDTNWNPFNLAASYTGTVPLFATIRITALSSTASAYVYVDDLFNGTNVVTALDTWDNGKPSTWIYEQIGDAAAVWAVSTTGLTTTSTTGKKLVDNLTTAKFIGLK